MSKSRDIADSAATINYIDNVTSDVQNQINTLDTALDNISVTSGTLTKTFASGESASISLTSSVLAPVVSVTKEVPQSGVTNNSWDVNSTTENYTRLDSAAATTLDWVASDDVSAATETSITLSGATQSTDLLGGTISNTGQNAYMLDQTDGTIYQYSLSVAYDLSSGSYESKTFNVLSQQSDPRNIFFKPDGTVLYVIGTTNQAIYQYSLSTAWDISTASYDSKTFSASSQSSGTSGLFIKPDGSKLYIVAYSNDAVYQYSLSTAWDISTASYDSVSLSVISQDSTPRDITFNDDGTVLYMCGTGNNALYQYALTTAYDLSSASYSSNTLSLSTTVFSITYSSASLQLVIFQSLTDILKTIRLSNTLTLGTGSFASADVGKTIEANSGVFVLTATDGSYVETTAPTSYAQVASGSWSMYGVVYNAADGDLELSGVFNPATAFDISTASYTQTFSVNAEGGNPKGLQFNNDGSKLFVVSELGQEVNEYALSTAYDIGSASFTTNFSVSSQTTLPSGLAFKNDGTRMYVAGRNSNSLSEYSLSTAFDISTASYVQTFNIAAQDNAPQSIQFNPNGTRLTVLGSQQDVLFYYTLSTAWDISTCSYNNNYYVVGSQATEPLGFVFSSNGNKIFVVDNGTNSVYEYNLSVAYDITTASYNSVSFSVAAEDSVPTGIVFNPSGNKMLVAGAVGDDVNEYSIGTTAIPTGYQPVHTTASTDTTYWTDINSMTADQNAGDGNVYYAISTDDRTTWTVIDNTDGERDIVRNNAGTWQYNSNGDYALETWVNGATNTELATLAEAMEGAESNPDLANAVFSNSFSVSSQDSTPAGVCFNTTGTKMFVVGGTSPDSVYEYTLSIAFNVATSSFVDSFDVSSQDIRAKAIAFNANGTKMFVVGSTNDSVFEYNLSASFDVSSASYSQSFSVASQETDPQGLAFNTNGTKMFVVGSINDSVFEYNLSSGFDISSASYSQGFSVSAKEGSTTGVAFNTDGTQMFVVGNSSDAVHQYNLSTGFDVSSAVFSKSFSVSSQDIDPQDITFSADGSKMFIVGETNASVYQYALTSYTNQMDKTQLDAVTDPNHIALGNDLDLAIVFNMTSGSTVPSSDGVAINYDANVLNKGAVLGTDYDFDAPAQNSVRITALAANNLKVRVV